MEIENLKLPVSSNSEGDLAHFDQMSQALDSAKTVEDKLKIGNQAHKIGKILDLAGHFDLAFKYSSLYCKAEFQVSKDSVGMDRHFKGRKHKDRKHQIKKAYTNLEKDQFEAGLKKLRLKPDTPSRSYFLTKGKPFGSGEFEWYTPEWVYERCRLVMGSIDLDPATSAQAIEMGNAPDKYYFTQEDNALLKTWPKVENIFINPPYTLKKGAEKDMFLDKNKKIEKSGAKAFLKKLCHCPFLWKRAMLLVLEDSGTSYGQFLWGLSNAVFIPSGRIDFKYKGKAKGTSTTRSTLIFGIGVDEIKFHLAFKEYGQCIFEYKHLGDINRELRARCREEGLIKFCQALEKLPRSEKRDKKRLKESVEIKKLYSKEKA